MSFRFKIKTPNNIEDKLLEVNREVVNEGGSFFGTTSSGSMRVKGLRARYENDGSYLTITVTEKPMFATEKMIKEAVMELLE